MTMERFQWHVGLPAGVESRFFSRCRQGGNGNPSRSKSKRSTNDQADLSLPGLAWQSSTHGRWLLDRPVKPGDDSEVRASNENGYAVICSALRHASPHPPVQ
jgi:hypothetical protein